MPGPSRKRDLNRLKATGGLRSIIGPKVLEGEHKDSDFWDDVYRRIRQGKLIPILGDAVRNNRIFDVDYDDNLGVSADDEGLIDDRRVDEELAETWADDIGYPLPERSKLARVAQYNRVISADPDQAKNKFLLFWKKCLLALAEEDESVYDTVPDLQAQIKDKSFSEIVAELDYPRFSRQQLDPLRMLAKLRLPIYVTTSYFDFMERALQAEGASQVRTQFCLWNLNEDRVAPEHRPDPMYKPSVEDPVVYHLYGYEQYPRSIVLSEDDYLDFLLALAQDTDTEKPLIPHYLRGALEESSLLLLGYRLQDWDFRVLFRGLINVQHSSFRALERMYSVAIQLDPKYQEGIRDEYKAREYLQSYFDGANFRVEWSSIDKFIATLWSEYDLRRRGQA